MERAVNRSTPLKLAAQSNGSILFTFIAFALFVFMYERKTLPSLNCGLDLIAEVLYGKWKMRLLWFIHEGHLRPSDLQRKIPDASRRVLNIQLKELEDHTLITKVIYPVMPPKVEYSLTDFGKSLIPIIGQIGQWADGHQEQLREVILKNIKVNSPPVRKKALNE